MKRRALLSAVAAGGLAGCLSGKSPPQVVGLDSRQVDTAHCGEVLHRPCGFVAGMSSSINRPLQIEEEYGGAVTTYYKNDRLVVRGYSLGYGDPSCGDARVSKIELTDRELLVSVHNDLEPSLLGCEGGTGRIGYRVAVAPGDKPVESVRVVHYSYKNEITLSGAISLEVREASSD